jgi:hypothetical protein
MSDLLLTTPFLQPASHKFLPAHLVFLFGSNHFTSISLFIVAKYDWSLIIMIGISFVHEILLDIFSISWLPMCALMHSLEVYPLTFQFLSTYFMSSCIVHCDHFFITNFPIFWFYFLGFFYLVEALKLFFHWKYLCHHLLI